jgi:hypothetical protein
MFEQAKESLCDLAEKWKAWNRLLSLMAALTLCWVFIEESKDRTIDWVDYFAYSVSMVICYTPTLASKTLDAFVSLKGGKPLPPDAPATGDPEPPKP